MGNRKRLAVLSVVVLALVLIVLSFAVVRSGGEKRTYTKVTVNMQNPWLHDDDVYFYTSSFFAKYNTRTNSIDRISDYVSIQNGISSPSWSPDAIVFQTNPLASNRDDVTTAAAQLGAKPYQPHWWKYDFQARQYELLALPGIDDCSLVVQVSPRLLTCVASQDEGDGAKALKTFDLVSGSSKTLFSTDDGITNVTSDGQNVYFTVSTLSGSQSLHRTSLSSGKDGVLFSGKNQLSYYVYKGGRVLVNELSARTAKIEDSHEGALPSSSSKQKLVLLEGGNITLDKTIKSPPISFFSNSEGAMLFSSLDGSISSVSKEGLETMVKPAKPLLSGGDFLFRANGKLYVISPDGKLSSSPATPRKDKYPSSFNTRDDNDKTGSSFIDASEGGKHDVYLYLPNVSSSRQEEAVGVMLEQKGFKSSEFNFTWIVDGADFHTPINPKAVVVD